MPPTKADPAGIVVIDNMIIVPDVVTLERFNGIKALLIPLRLALQDSTTKELLCMGAVVKQLTNTWDGETPYAVVMLVEPYRHSIRVVHQHLDSEIFKHVTCTLDNVTGCFEVLGFIEDMHAILPNSVPR